MILEYFLWYINNPIPAFFLTLLQFVLLMTFRSKFENTILKWPLIIWFVWQDWVMNWFLSIIFLDAPHGWDELVTGRMNRYLPLEDDDSFGVKFKISFATALCTILNAVDPYHCKFRNM